VLVIEFLLVEILWKNWGLYCGIFTVLREHCIPHVLGRCGIHSHCNHFFFFWYCV